MFIWTLGDLIAVIAFALLLAFWLLALAIAALKSIKRRIKRVIFNFRNRIHG